MLTLAQRLLRRDHPRQGWLRSRCEVPHPRRPRQPLFWLLASYQQRQLRGESKSGGVELDTEDPVTFKSFVTWLYTYKLNRPVKTAIFAHGKPLDSHEEILTLWYPGDRREIPLLMNETANAVRGHAVDTWIMPLADIAKIYEQTSDNAPPRRLVGYLTALTNPADSSSWRGRALAAPRVCRMLW